MTHQETSSPNLFTLSKPLPTDPAKNNAIIGVTCKRYYVPTREEKRDSSHIPLKVFVDQENEKEVLDMSNTDNTEPKAHNWENDPLGLCLPEQKNETVSKETTSNAKSDTQDDNHQAIEQINGISTDSIVMEEIISPIVGTMSRYMTATSEDFAHIDGISPVHSPPLRPPEPCNGLMWKIQGPLSRWLYQNKKEEEGEETSVDAYTTAWDAIFHPMSTFQYVKGELEYYNWNPDDAPVTDDLVVQRVSQAQPVIPVASEATLPQLAPTPLLKPSPVLTLDDDIESVMVHEVTNPDKQKHYFTMLQNIRAPSLSIEAPQEDKVGSKHTDEKRLFWFGFLCPLLWFYGSVSRHKVNKRWQKRCRLAALYFSVVVSIVSLVIVVKMAGHAASRQSQSDKIRAVIAN